jgi:chromosome segregation ATPase
MTTRNRPIALAVTMVGAALLAMPVGAAFAQAARSGGGNNAQLMQQLQQLASERTALQAENAKMKTELAAMTKERDELKSGRAALEQRARAAAAGEAALARSAQDKENADKELERQKERMQELVTRFRETAQTLRDVETERTTFKQSLNEQSAQLAACKTKNEALFKLNDEVLARFEGQGTLSRVASAEPFTKLKRVELENLIDDYRYRAEDQKVEPTAMPPKPQVSNVQPAGSTP